MANKAINRAYLKDVLKTYNERIDDAVVGALTTDIIGEDNAETGAKKGIQTLTVVDNSDTTVAAADREKLLTIVPAINELDREIGDADLTVVDNSDPAIAAADRPVLPIITDAINELDRKQGDADLTVIDTTADPAETVAKDNISDAINVLDKEMGDCATITVEDTTNPIYDPTDPAYEPTAVLKPEIEVVSSLNVLDKEMGDTNTITVVDVLAGEDKPKKIVVEAINTLDKEMGDDELTVVDTTADPAKTDAETEVRAAINVLDKEIGDANTLTVVDTLDPAYDPANPILKKVLVEAINVLDKEIGDLSILESQYTHLYPADVEKDAAHYFKYIAEKLGWKPFLGWPEDSSYPRSGNSYTDLNDFISVAGMGSEGHPYYGDHFWAYIEDTGSLMVTSGYNGVHYSWYTIYGAKKMGRLELLLTWKKDTIVDAINSALKQSVVSIEDVPLDPADLDYAKVEHRYVFKQNYPDGTDPEVPTTIIGTIDIDKPKFIKKVTTFRSDGTEIDPQTGLPLIEGHLYMKILVENQEMPLYLDINQLIVDFTVEDTPHIDLTIEEKEVAGERMRVVSADVVPNSLGHTELTMPTNRELDFTGYDHAKGDGSPEHFELCTPGAPGALTVVTGAPQENEVSLERVETINQLAGWGQKIIVGDTVLHKDLILPGDPQLDTDAQNLREAINELYHKMGDIEVVDSTHIDLTVTKEDGEAPILTADIVPDSVSITELDEAGKNRYMFTGFDDIIGPSYGSHYTKCAEDDPDALEVVETHVVPAPAGKIYIHTVNVANDAAGYVEAIQVGDFVKWIDVPEPSNKQLLTDAQTLRGGINELKDDLGNIDELTTSSKSDVVTAINELDEKQGDEVLTTVAQTISGAINEVNLIQEVRVADVLDPGTYNLRAYQINQLDADGDIVTRGTIEIPFTQYEGSTTDTIKVETDYMNHPKTITANVIDGSIGRTQLDTEVNEILDAVPTKLHIIACTTYEDFVANIMPDANVPANSAVILTNKFKIGDAAYMAGTWAYKAIDAAGTVVWQYMNNGGEMETIIIDLGTNPLPSPTTPEEIAAIKTNAIYVTEDDHGDKKSYIYLKRSATAPTANEWLQISAGDKGIEWMGTYNYIATTIIIDPDTGLPTTKVVPWEATPEQLAGMTTWFVTKFGRQPTVNDLITLTVDEAYYGQYLFKNDVWNEYSSLTKATKAQYGVTVFATLADYANTVTNKAIDPWLLKQILDEFKDEFVTKDYLDERLDEKVDMTYLTSVYYDKTVVDSKLQALQKAYIVHEDPEQMTPERLQKYYGSLVYWKDGDTTKSYIIDSEGNIENLGEAGISLDGYVTTTDAKYLTLKDIKLIDDDGNALTVQKQLDKKLDTPTGAITTVINTNLTPGYSVVSNYNGKITSGPITATELSALQGIDVSDLATRSVELRLQALEAGGGTSSVAITNVTTLPTVAPNIYTIYHLTTNTTQYPAGYYACTSINPFSGEPVWARLDNVSSIVEVAGTPSTLITNPSATTIYKDTTTLSVWMWTAGVWTKINGGGGTAADLFINGVLLEGNKTSEDLKIVKALTKAQYNALSPTEQMNGTIYLITDDNGGGYVQPGNIIDNLYSTDSQSALSANQGRILDGKIATNASSIAGFNTQVQQLANRVVAVEGQTTAMGTQVTNLAQQVAAVTDPTIPNGLAQRVQALEQGQSSIAKLIQGIKNMFIYDSTGKILTIDPTKLDDIIF